MHSRLAIFEALKLMEDIYSEEFISVAPKRALLCRQTVRSRENTG